MKVLVFILLVLFLLACQSVKEEKQPSQIANPASVFCVNNSGTLDIRSDENSSQIGYCKFNNGKECEEWSYFRGECKLDKCESCPMLSPPSPDFCKGGRIIPGITNECGCTSPPKCELPRTPTSAGDIMKEVLGKSEDVRETNSKFLVNFPWKKGESWSFVSDFHDENCLDFANFDSKKAPVFAAADGEVLISTHSYPNDFNTYSPVETDNPEDMGNFVVMYHEPQTYTVYMHFQQELIPPVKSGDKVKAGQRIGYEGNTGWSHGEHLHFCVVDVSIFPEPSFITKPLDSWGFKEMDGSNKLILNQKYVSQNE